MATSQGHGNEVEEAATTADSSQAPSAGSFSTTGEETPSAPMTTSTSSGAAKSGGKATPPSIDSVSWGEIHVSGPIGLLKDAKLWPGGGRAWDWRETGTRHSPGVQVADVEELLAHGADVVVLSRGMDRKLGVPPATVSALEARGVVVHVAETREAVALYNELAGKAMVGGLFHSTC